MNSLCQQFYDLNTNNTAGTGITPYFESALIFRCLDPSGSTQQPIGTIPPIDWPMRTFVAYSSIHLQLGGKTVSMLSFRPSWLVL